ncbi:UBN2_3 domain-containing protein, partial [Cephalotus follicularis]
TNYLSWRTQIMPFLRGQQLFGYVNGTSVCPLPTDVEAYNNWQQQDNNLMSIFVGFLSAEVIPTIHQASTSKQIWDTLKEAYACPSNTRILSLHLTLQNIKHKPDESITQFLQRTKTLHYELAVAGRPISLEDFNLYIFKALREDFKVMIPNLIVRPDPLSFSELQSLLVSHEFLNKRALTKLSLNPTYDTPSVNTAIHCYPTALSLSLQDMDRGIPFLAEAHLEAMVVAGGAIHIVVVGVPICGAFFAKGTITPTTLVLTVSSAPCLDHTLFA